MNTEAYDNKTKRYIQTHHISCTPCILPLLFKILCDISYLFTISCKTVRYSNILCKNVYVIQVNTLPLVPNIWQYPNQI